MHKVTAVVSMLWWLALGCSGPPESPFAKSNSWEELEPVRIAEDWFSDDIRHQFDRVPGADGGADEVPLVPTDAASDLRSLEAIEADAATDSADVEEDAQDMPDAKQDLHFDVPDPEDAEVTDISCEPACDACGDDDGCGAICFGDFLCDDGNSCTLDICKPYDDEKCMHVPLSGFVCGTDDLCAGQEVCKDGVCTVDVPLDCDDGNLCTDDVCEPDTGCTNPPNQLPCDDGDWCTDGDQCSGGTCESVPKNCPVPADSPCLGLCDSEAGECFMVPTGAGIEICDGLDNDCDGNVDEGILVNSPEGHVEHSTGCMYQGVCAQGAVAICDNDAPIPGEAQWECDYSQVKNHADAVWNGMFGLKEYKCDGLDNDCDGQTDEELDQDFGVPATNPKWASGCPLQGFCANTMKWSCQEVDGKPAWVCDPSGVPFYELEETKCDGVDNDCDGTVDEELWDVGPDGATCKSKGVCSEGGVFAECKHEGGDAFWLCHYDLVVGYDLNNPDNEVMCDGLDNDCDGQVDENLDEDEVWKTAGGCATIGVCDSPMLKAVCDGVNGWSCLYTLLEDWVPDEEGNEFGVCDGLDNDCDGFVDELACEPCEPCEEDGQCVTGECGAEPSVAGDAKYCSLSKNYCVFIEPGTGECNFRQSGNKACGTMDQACVCSDGLWFCDIPGCKGSKPLCYEGECRVCIPFTEKCQGKTILRCDNDGLAWSVKGVCGYGQVCMGGGACPPNDELKVNIKDVAKSASTDVKPRVARRAGGGFMVVYQSDGVPGSQITEVVGRVYDEQLQPLASEFIVNAFETSSNQEKPDIAAIPTKDGGFVVVWEDRKADGDNSGLGVSAQIVGDDGSLVGQRFRVSEEIEGDQENPRIAALYHQAKKEVRFMVIWENEVTGAENQPDIYGRLWKLDGNGDPLAMSDDIVVNWTLESGQRFAALTNLVGDGFLAAWSTAHIDTNDVFQQWYDAGMSQIGLSEMVNVYTSGSQKNPSVAGSVDYMAGNWVVAFDSYGPDGDKAGIFMQLFPDPEVQDIPVNNIWTGQQREPAVAVLADNDIVVTWESENLTGLGDSDKYGIAARQFDESGFPVQDDEFLVNQTFQGDQRNPHVATLEGGAYVVVWASAIGKPPPQGIDYDIYARLFAPE